MDMCRRQTTFAREMKKKRAKSVWVQEVDVAVARSHPGRFSGFLNNIWVTYLSHFSPFHFFYSPFCHFLSFELHARVHRTGRRAENLPVVRHVRAQAATCWIESIMTRYIVRDSYNFDQKTMAKEIMIRRLTDWKRLIKQRNGPCRSPGLMIDRSTSIFLNWFREIEFFLWNSMEFEHGVGTWK